MITPRLHAAVMIGASCVFMLCLSLGMFVFVFAGDLCAVGAVMCLLVLFATLGALGLHHAPPRDEMSEDEWSDWSAW